MKQMLPDSLENLKNWAVSNSLWYYVAGTGCCADEMLSTLGCRYDIERLGLLPQSDPAKADLLIVNGLITPAAKEELKALFERMNFPKYVIAVGACACSVGIFSTSENSPGIPVDRIIPVDVYVAGCPPRPEAILNGIIELQKKIREKNATEPKLRTH